MLSNNLNTNEVKNAAGTEVEFQHLRQEGRTREFAAVGEAYNAPYRLRLAHTESGKGLDTVRRSMNQFRKTVVGASGALREIIVTISAQIPVGDLASNDEVENVIANSLSFNASLGASTTILYDGTGNGAVSLKDGSL